MHKYPVVLCRLNEPPPLNIRYILIKAGLVVAGLTYVLTIFSVIFVRSSGIYSIKPLTLFIVCVFVAPLLLIIINVFAGI